MGLFIIIAILISIYLMFCSDGLINYFKTMNEYNEKVMAEISREWFNFDTHDKYSEKDLKTICKGIMNFILMNIFLNILNLAVVFAVSVLMILFLEPKHYNYSFDIKSLKDSSAIEGKIYYRGWYINEEMNYYFLRDNEYGEIMGHIPASKTYIKYDNESYPHITVFKEIPKPAEWYRKIFFDFSYLRDKTVRYELVVPSGTTIEDVYEIDLE